MRALIDLPASGTAVRTPLLDLLRAGLGPAAFSCPGHKGGAGALPALREVIGKNPGRPIYIYCNNNFTDNRAPVVTKRIDMALNIPTFVNLHGYGYGNVWELADLVSTAELGKDWVRGAKPRG